MLGGLSFVYFSLASKEKYIAVRAKPSLTDLSKTKNNKLDTHSKNKNLSHSR